METARGKGTEEAGNEREGGGEKRKGGMQI